MTSEFEATEIAFLAARDSVSDEELVARVKAAPDMGGVILVELGEFLEGRADRQPT